ncbi:MAG: hypothetical protein AAF664_23060, partial [Planctomycetota bacterium]
LRSRRPGHLEYSVDSVLRMKSAQRILVGTMYCGEAQLESCLRAIHEQDYPHWEHFLIENLPNRQAHAELYRKFVERKAEFALFAKIDADMVLTRPTVFSEVITWFERNPRFLGLQVALEDYFTAQLILGMNFFRSSVEWGERNDAVFVDSGTVKPNQRYNDFTDIGPAATHCEEPSSFQSFHFGIHKGIKFLAARAAGSSRRVQKNFHLENIELTYRHYRSTKDGRLCLASLGAELALDRYFSVENLDFSDELVHATVTELEGMSEAEREAKLQGLRKKNRSNVPVRSFRVASYRRIHRLTRALVKGRDRILQKECVVPVRQSM